MLVGCHGLRLKVKQRWIAVFLKDSNAPGWYFVAEISPFRDFDRRARAEQRRAPKVKEWTGLAYAIVGLGAKR